MRNYDYNDDFADMIDQCLSMPGVCETYHNGRDYAWIIKVGNEHIRDGLKHLSKKQIAIIEAFFFEGKCMQDICNKYCLSHDEVQQEISTMRVTMVK